MIDLGLNQYKIEEIRYRVNSEKVAVIKLHNFNIYDMDIEYIKEEDDVWEKRASTIRKEKEAESQKEQTKSETKKILHNLDCNRTKNLMEKLDKVPYKVYEKIGTLHVNDENEGWFETESDEDVVNDNRETKNIIIPSRKNKTQNFYDSINLIKENDSTKTKEKNGE